MIKPEQVPPIVIATLARALISKEGGVDDAIAAALNAWPGMHFIGNIGVHLPLPQEASDDQ